MTQNTQIANYLKTGKLLTKPVALKKFGSWRLAARIFDLRTQEKMVISTTTNRNGDIAYQFVGMVPKRKTKRSKKRSR